MGRRKKFSNDKGGKMKYKTKVERKESPLDPSARSFIYDEADDFNDEDNYEYNSNTKVFREEVTEEHVLGIGGLSSEEDESDISSTSNNDEELFEDGIESNAKYHVLDERMMGRRKRDYFGTDIPDEKIHNEAKQRSKGEPLSLIEDGARKLQQRLAAQFEGLSYSHLLPQEDTTVPESKLDDEVEEVCDKPLSKKKRLKILQQKSPEFMPTIEFLKERCEEVISLLSPLIEAKKKGILPSSPCVEYLQTRYMLCLNYMCVATSYLAIRSSESYSSDHPVITRLAQFRHLFKEFEICKTKFEPELSALLEDLAAGRLKCKKKAVSSRKMLDVISKLGAENENKDEDKDEPTSSLEDAEIDELNSDSDVDSDEEVESKAENRMIGTLPKTLSADDRRKISYKISKNKGLMPSRKKEQRNPRVKYKNKYQKKLKRRKGQVREVRKELHKYSGEMSGIKANLVKSRKLK